SESPAFFRATSESLVSTSCAVNDVAVNSVSAAATSVSMSLILREPIIERSSRSPTDLRAGLVPESECSIVVVCEGFYGACARSVSSGRRRLSRTLVRENETTDDQDQSARHARQKGITERE